MNVSDSWLRKMKVEKGGKKGECLRQKVERHVMVCASGGRGLIFLNRYIMSGGLNVANRV